MRWDTINKNNTVQRVMYECMTIVFENSIYGRVVVVKSQKAYDIIGNIL